MNGQHNEPDGDASSDPALRRRKVELAALAAQHPNHHIWTE